MSRGIAVGLLKDGLQYSESAVWEPRVELAMRELTYGITKELLERCRDKAVHGKQGAHVALSENDLKAVVSEERVVRGGRDRALALAQLRSLAEQTNKNPLPRLSVEELDAGGAVLLPPQEHRLTTIVLDEGGEQGVSEMSVPPTAETVPAAGASFNVKRRKLGHEMPSALGK